MVPLASRKQNYKAIILVKGKRERKKKTDIEIETAQKIQMLCRCRMTESARKCGHVGKIFLKSKVSDANELQH